MRFGAILIKACDFLKKYILQASNYTRVMGLAERLDTCWEISDLEIREDTVRRRDIFGEHYVEEMRYLVGEA